MKRRCIFIESFSAVLGLALVFSWSSVPDVVAQMGALDGKTFVGEFGKKGKKAKGRIRSYSKRVSSTPPPVIPTVSAMAIILPLSTGIALPLKRRLRAKRRGRSSGWER